MSRPGPRSPTTRARAPAARQLSGSPPASRPPTWRRPPPATATTTTRTRTTRRRPPAASPPASRLRAPRRPTEQRAHDLPPRPGRRHARLLRSADPPPPPPPRSQVTSGRSEGPASYCARAGEDEHARTHARTPLARALHPPDHAPNPAQASRSRRGYPEATPPIRRSHPPPPSVGSASKAPSGLGPLIARARTRTSTHARTPHPPGRALAPPGTRARGGASSRPRPSFRPPGLAAGRAQGEGFSGDPPPPPSRLAHGFRLHSSLLLSPFSFFGSTPSIPPGWGLRSRGQAWWRSGGPSVPLLLPRLSLSLNSFWSFI